MFRRISEQSVRKKGAMRRRCSQPLLSLRRIPWMGGRMHQSEWFRLVQNRLISDSKVGSWSGSTENLVMTNSVSEFGAEGPKGDYSNDEEMVMIKIHEDLIEDWPEETLVRRDALIQALVRGVGEEIDRVVAHVDSIRTSNNASSSNKSHHHMHSSLSQRYQKFFEKELKRHRRKRANGKPTHKMTIQEIWDDALNSAGIRIPMVNMVETSHSSKNTGFNFFSDAINEEEHTMEGSNTPIPLTILGENDLEITSINSNDACNGDQAAEILDGSVSPVKLQKSSPLFALSLDENDHMFPGDVASFMDIKEADLILDGMEVQDELQPEKSTAAEMKGKAFDSADNMEEHVFRGIYQALAILGSTTTKEWASFDHASTYRLDSKFDAIDVGESEKKNSSIGGNRIDTSSLHVNATDDAWKLLDLTREHGHILSTNESNLVLSRLLTSSAWSVNEILETSLQLFDRMVKLGKLERDDGGPDALTYRLLFLALPRRLMAVGEAVKICRQVSESSMALSGEALIEGMKVCKSYHDLRTARKLMEPSLDRSIPVRPSVRSCTILVEMLLTEYHLDDAMSIFEEIRDANMMHPEDEDKLLLHLCRGITRQRRPESVRHRIEVLKRIFDTLVDKLANGERPTPHLWHALIEALSASAESNTSLEHYVNKAIQTLLDWYPNKSPGLKLLRISLGAAEVTGDTKCLGELIRREVGRKSISSFGHSNREGGKEGNSILPIPHFILTKSLEICLNFRAVDTASTIIDTFNSVAPSYPIEVGTRLNSLALQCYARAGYSHEAKKVLMSMVEEGIQPSDDLFGATLHSLISENKNEEALHLFQSMERSDSGFPAPETSSFNAMLVIHVQAREWDEMIGLANRMKERNIEWSPETLQGLILAHRNRNGEAGMIEFLESALQSKSQVDESTLRLTSRILVSDLVGSLDDIRKTVRKMGEQEPRLRTASLRLIRSMRMAQVNERERRTKARSTSRQKSKEEENDIWQNTLRDLLHFYQCRVALTRDTDLK